MRGKHLMLAAAVAAVGGAGASSLAAQTGFNGVITFTQDRDGKPATFVQTTKGRKVRLQGFGSDSGALIVDGDAKVMMMVNPKEQQYMVMTDEDAKQMAAMAEQMKAKHPEADRGQMSFTNTGRRETVAGVPCEVWHGTYSGGESDEKREGDACMAKGVGFALAEITLGNPMLQRGAPGWSQMQQYRDLVAGGKGILKATTIKDGKVTTELEATKIEPKVVSDDAFKPPAGYKEIRMGDMMLKAQNAMKEMRDKMKANQGKSQP
ncbi:MAG TPA: DUF4412 domain-containing protein [Gemmatimonadales bacterium]|jgi:hypothetical protein|nr:DUF4412 domain-containing protein [Gemmatimonadales bacterium]